MGNLKDAGIDLAPDTKVKISMKVGRLTLQPAKVEWLDERRKVKHKGIVLHMKDAEHGGAGYAELDLSKAEDRKVYDVLVAWLEENDDPRIRDFQVRILSKDTVPAPLAWWDTAHWKSLLADVSRGIRIMPDEGQRRAYVENCVRYENQRDEPRKGLIDGLLAIELDGVSESDPLAVPEV